MDKPGMAVAPVIREYRHADESAVVAVVRDLQRYEGALFDRMLPPDAIGPWYVERRLQECAAARGAVLVAELEGAVVGYATFLAEVSSEDDHDETDYLYAAVGDLGVARDWRGRGIGTALLAECEARARQSGREWLRISVLAANGGALALYRRLGYEPLILSLEKRLN